MLSVCIQQLRYMYDESATSEHWYGILLEFYLELYYRITYRLYNHKDIFKITVEYALQFEFV